MTELEQARALEDEVKAARKAGDIATLAAQARDAIGQIEILAEASSGEVLNEILRVGKRIGYNAGADIWPGWEEGVVRTAPELAAGRELAEISARFVELLGQGDMQRGNAVWLIGAFDLAMGDRAAAAARFQSTIGLFAADPAMKLLGEGYLALAQRDPDFDRVIASLETVGGEDAGSIREQLITAHAIYG